MKLDDADLEQSYFQSIRKGTDNTVGYLLACLIVVFFFSIYLMGMQHVQTASDHLVGERTAVSTEVQSEIGDSADQKNR